MKKILVIGLSSDFKAGTENVVFNYIKHVNTGKIKVDLLFKKECSYIGRISDLGINKIIVSKNICYDILKNYDYIWYHTGSPIRNKIIFKSIFLKGKLIIHSHASFYRNLGYYKSFKLFLFKIYISTFANKLWSCSKFSTEQLFSNLYKNKIRTFPNAIDVEKFERNFIVRNEIRSSLKWTNNYIIGNISRMSYEKNHEFIILLFNEVLKKMPEARLILVGSGPDENNIKNLVEEFGISDFVHFAGWQFDTEKYYNSFDLFLLPSRYEGFPLSALEAQANGLDVLISKESYDNRLNVTGKVHNLSLKDDINLWVDKIIELEKNKYEYPFENIYNDFTTKKFNVRENAKLLENYFLGFDSDPFI